MQNEETGNKCAVSLWQTTKMSIALRLGTEDITARVVAQSRQSSGHGRWYQKACRYVGQGPRSHALICSCSRLKFSEVPRRKRDDELVLKHKKEEH